MDYPKDQTDFSPEAIRARGMRPIGDDMAQRNPLWARWFDALKASGTTRLGGFGGGGRGVQPQTTPNLPQDQGPHGFLGTNGADDDLYAIHDQQQARPSLAAMQSLLGRKR